MENNVGKNFKKLGNSDSSHNIQILTMIINNNIYNFNDFNLNNILLPFLIHTNKQSYYNPQKNTFIFPEAIDIDSLQLFCNFLLKPEKVNMNKFTYLKKILNVSVFFNAIEIINNICDKYIISKINKDNCLEIIIYFLDFIYTENENIKNIFIKIIQQALILISQNLIYFLNNKQTELYSLNGETLEEIIELYLKNVGNNKILKEDIKNVLELLIYSRGISNDIFLLLENERKKAINNFESIFLENNISIEPTFIWNISYKDIKKENYKETTTCLDGINILLISYYDNLSDSFQLAIQILEIKNNNSIIFNNNIITDNNNEKINLLNTSTAKKINNDEEILLSEEGKKEEKKEEFLINILSLCEIPEINYKSHINFNGIYTKNTNPFLICKIDNFLKKFKNQKKEVEFSLKIYFSRNYIFPKIIEHICQYFEKYYNYPSINKLPRSAMNILLKNEIISNEPNKENYKLFAIENWIKNKNGIISKKYMDIFKNIDWKKIDNDKLIDFFLKNAKIISKDESLKNDLFFEIQRRLQEEYFSYFNNNNKSYLNNSKSISAYYEDINNIDKNNYSSFTFDFLTKIISVLILNNKNNFETTEYLTNCDNSKDITYVFPIQEEKVINFPITQRNNIPTHKISKSIIIDNSPLLNDNKNNLKYKNEVINKNNKIKNKKKINNHKIIPTNRPGDKRSSNNSISSYQINLSGISQVDYINSGNGSLNIYNNKNINNQKSVIDKNTINSFTNKGIKSFTPNNSKGKFIIKNKNIKLKYNKTISSKPLRIKYKKVHSKSLDKVMFFSGEKNTPIDSTEKKVGLFPNYINNVQNGDEHLNDILYNKKLIQIKKRFQINNTSKIPFHYYNDNQKNNINKNDKMSLIICKNDGSLSKKYKTQNNLKRKKQNNI